MPARGIAGKTPLPVGPRATKSSPAPLHPPPAALNGTRETLVPVGFVGKLRHGAANRAWGAAPHLPTGLGQAPFVVFRSPPSIAPAKASERGGGQRQLGNAGSREEEEGEREGGRQMEISGGAFPGRKVAGESEQHSW